MLVGGTSALVAAMGLERGLSFLAAFLAARLGGPSVLGAYSLAITTANNVATYAGSGMGTTANRFSGQYSRQHPGYAALVRALVLISAISALIALAFLFFAARPFAQHLIHNPGLTGLLQWAAFSAAAMILLECCRGFLIGQRRFAALLISSAIVGIGMVSGLPIAAHWGPSAMVMVQTSVFLTAVTVCVVFAKPLGLTPLAGNGEEQTGPSIGQVWSFGLVQLASIITMNAAGWWLMSLVARADASLVQMGLFAVSHQVRNMAALAPSLLTQSSYALLTDETAPAHTTADAIMALCTFVSALGTLLLAGPVILVLPWAMPLIYGRLYATGALPTALALLTAVVHMGGAPAAARLSIVAVRESGAINAIWAVAVALLATWFVPTGGAREATAIYFAAHLLSMVLVLAALRRHRRLPPGIVPVTCWTIGGTVMLSVLAWIRASVPEYQGVLTLVSAVVLLVTCAGLIRCGKRWGWLPAHLDWRTLVQTAKGWRRGGTEADQEPQASY